MAKNREIMKTENPGNIMTQVQLKGDNYEKWATAIWTLLRATQKWRFVEGKIANSG